MNSRFCGGQYNGEGWPSRMLVVCPASSLSCTCQTRHGTMAPTCATGQPAPVSIVANYQPLSAWTAENIVDTESREIRQLLLLILFLKYLNQFDDWTIHFNVTMVYFYLIDYVYLYYFMKITHGSRNHFFRLWLSYRTKRTKCHCHFVTVTDRYVNIFLVKMFKIINAHSPYSQNNNRSIKVESK